MAELTGRWAVVTGASSGLGVEFARGLAERGANLVLVARREERLRKLAGELEAAHRVTARAVALDLARPDAPRELAERLAAERIEVDVLVNNAGFGLYGPFAEIPWEREREMLSLDVLALVELTKRFLPGMLARNRGWVLQVASIGAFQPSPTYATYSAAKAFVLSFGEALAYELRGSAVRVTVVSPGATRTEFLEVSGQKSTFFQRVTFMDARSVAESGLRAMLRGRASVVPGLSNQIAAFSVRLLPRRVQAAIANFAMNVS